jgi:DNA-binding winged helix-turn-helix (wHTH) protein
MSRILKFGVFEVDPKAGELRKHGMKQKLAGQPMQLLVALMERSQEVVTREELRQLIWPENVSLDYDLALKKAVNRARGVLGDSAESPRYIETIPRKGYRFLAPVLAVNRSNGNRFFVDIQKELEDLDAKLGIVRTEIPENIPERTAAESEVERWRYLVIVLAVALAAIATIAWLKYGRTVNPLQAVGSPTSRAAGNGVSHIRREDRYGMEMGVELEKVRVSAKKDCRADLVFPQKVDSCNTQISV